MLFCSNLLRNIWPVIYGLLFRLYSPLKVGQESIGPLSWIPVESVVVGVLGPSEF